MDVNYDEFYYHYNKHKKCWCVKVSRFDKKKLFADKRSEPTTKLITHYRTFVESYVSL